MDTILFMVSMAAVFFLYSKLMDTYVAADTQFISQVIRSPKSTIFGFPIGEELFFRGLPLLVTDDIFSPAYLGSHLLFTLGHALNYKKRFYLVAPCFAIGAVSFAHIAVTWGLYMSIIFHVVLNAIDWFSLKRKYARVNERILYV